MYRRNQLYTMGLLPSRQATLPDVTAAKRRAWAGAKAGRGYNRDVMARTDVEFTFDQALATLGVTPAKLQKLIQDGTIPASRPDGVHIQIPREAILEYLAQVSAVPLKQRTK